MPLTVDVDPDDVFAEKLRRGEPIEIPRVPLAGTDYEVFSRFALIYKPVGDEPGWRMMFDANGGVPRCVSFAMEKTDIGREIRSQDLRAVNVEDALELAASLASKHQITPDHGIDRLAGGSIRAVRAARRTARRKITDDLLREVAAVYRQQIGNNPTEAVADHLGVAMRTAGLYVRRARDAGFLGPALRGKAGER